MPLIDFDDIQAQINREREVAVKAGASPRATKYEDSPLKQMVAKAVEESTPSVAEEFAEYQKNTPLPGYNFVSTQNAFRKTEEVIQANKEAIEASKEDAEEQKRLQKEAKENEDKITRTSTGQPKVVNGEEVTPLQEVDKEEKGVFDVTGPKSSTTPNPSPVGSGDAKSSQASKDNK